MGVFSNGGQHKGYIMTPHKAQRLAKLTEQMAEIVMAAAICAQEIRGQAQEEFQASGDVAPPDLRPGLRPRLRVA